MDCLSICAPPKELDAKVKKTLFEFRKNWESEEKIFEEFCFCLLTPQSSARQAIKTINLLKQHQLLDKGSVADKEVFLRNVRFYKTKARRLREAQSRFPKHKLKNVLKENGLPKNPVKCREFLLKEVNGYGMKEASHFLRNIGFGDSVAILDRHILKNLIKCGIINEMPKSITKRKYLEIEDRMRAFCSANSLNFAELDLVFWSNETGEVLK